jgi:Ca-activated chloride channel family protein
MVLAAIAGLALVSVQGTSETGGLAVLGRDGKAVSFCPLKSTDVNADIAGFGARVTVVQKFSNTSKAPIEAVYTFPLPSDAAVDRMRMKIGNRVIEGEIKRREEARQIYEVAKQQGKIASLLDQERPNVFTQAVSNIMPGASVEIEISYVQVLKYEEGTFEFVFPMVVGPRFTGDGTPDPDKITPPIVAKGLRTGTDIRLRVNLDAGADITSLQSVLHDIRSDRVSDSRAVVELARRNEIPNRDFILRYSCAAKGVQSAFLTHAGDKGKFFTLILLPPKATTRAQVAPKEILFVMDQSGSQQGFPIQKSIELTQKLIDRLGANDTFNVISFADQARALWPEPRTNDFRARDEAKKFVGGLKANGGTMLMPAVDLALRPRPDPKRVRIVVFNTDGFVGNEFEILDAIQKNRGQARMFTFGIGNGVNRFLIDAMSAEGRGDSEVVTLAEKADAAIERFLRRTNSPLLTDIQVAVDGVAVTDLSPAVIPDVFSEKPIILNGRYAQGGKATIVISGRLAGQPWTQELDVVFPNTDKDGSALATLWARRKIDDLMRSDWLSVRSGNKSDSTEAMTNLALQFGLVSQFTSFVAVEHRVVNVGGKQRRVEVPVEMTSGVSYEGIFGDTMTGGRLALRAQPQGGAGGGFGGGGFGGGAPVANAPASTKAVLGEAKDAESEMTPEQRKKAVYEAKVSQELRAMKTGAVEIQINVKSLDDKLTAQIAKLGVSVSFSDKALKIIFGKADVSKLFTLAQIEDILRITRLN